MVIFDVSSENVDIVPGDFLGIETTTAGGAQIGLVITGKLVAFCNKTVRVNRVNFNGILAVCL